MSQKQPRRGKRVTMKDVALEAGVTTSSVSLVFRGKHGVSPVTREKIMRIARRLGYAMDPFTATLMTSRRKGKLPASSPVLAFASAYPTPDGWRLHSPAFGDYFDGASARAAEKGYRLESFWLGNEGALGRRASEVFYTRNIRGVLLAPLPDELASLEMDWKRFHAVALGFSMIQPALHRVSCDHLQSMMAAFRRCHVRGYRRMGIILTRGSHERVDRRWLAAYLLEQERLPGVKKIRPLLIANWDDRVFFDWLDRERPDVIMGHSGDFLRTKLTESGRRIPKDIGLVSLDNRTVDSTISGIFENPRRIGARAVDHLVGFINGHVSGIPARPSTLLIDGVWVPGETLRSAPAEPTPSPNGETTAGALGAGVVSMRDVAARAGVHPATVSLSLKNHPRIPQTTRNRVHAAAAELGYRKNPYIAELMKSRRSRGPLRKKPVLAFVTAFSTPDGWKQSSYLFYQYFLGARRRARALGFDLDEIWLPEISRGLELSDTMRARGIEGLLLPPLPAAGMPLQLRWEHFCLVGFGFTLERPRLHRVASDTYNSMRLAIRECKRLGYRRIGFALSTNADARVQNRWTAAFLMQRRENPEGLLPRYLIVDDWKKKPVKAWLDQEQPDLILTPLPDEFKEWLPSWGCRYPQDIGLASLNCVLGTWLSGIDQNGKLLGAHAIDMLVGLIERNEYGIPDQPKTLVIEGAWNPGTSVHRCRCSPTHHDS